MNSPQLRVALVHDWLTVPAGAELVLEALLGMFPDAPIYTLLYDRRAFVDSPIGNRRVITSFIDRLPLSRRNHRRYLPLMGHAIEQFDLSDFDVVISNVFAVSQGVLTAPRQLHLAYCNRTMSYAWGTYHHDLAAFGVDAGLAGILARTAYHFIRQWDYLAFRRPDVIVSNSRYTKRALLKHYGRDSEVLYPPVVMKGDPLVPLADRSHYVFVGRLVPQKRVDIIVSAFNQLGLPLHVVGDGPLLKSLAKAAGPNITLVGWQSRAKVEEELAHAKALLLPSEEAFGLVALEAQAVGTPVIAFRRGGAAEVIVEGETGVLFDHQHSDAVVGSVLAMSELAFDPRRIVAHASQFGLRQFQESLDQLIMMRWQTLNAG